MNDIEIIPASSFNYYLELLNLFWNGDFKAETDEELDEIENKYSLDV